MIVTHSRMCRCALLLGCGLATVAPAQVLPGLASETVVSGLDRAVAMAFAPDGRLFVAERGSSTVRVVEDGVLGGVWANPVGDLSGGEGGLLGIAVDPDFQVNGHVYIYNTRDIGGVVEGVVERWTDQNGVGVQPTRIGPLITTQRRHCGGPLVFDQSGALLVVVGDGSQSPVAQSLAHSAGKVLRMRAVDGAPLPDNPWFGVAGAVEHVWAYGIRNSFGLAIHPPTGDLYQTENGGRGGDEVNRIVRAGNYGWPVYDGFEPVPDPVAVDPLWTRRLPDPALTGVAFTTGTFLPAAYRDVLFGANFNLGGLFVFDIDTSVPSMTQATHYPASTTSFDVAEGPDGAVYVLDDPTPRARGASRLVRYEPATLPRPAVHLKSVSNVAVGGSITVGLTAAAGDAAVAWLAGRTLPTPLPTPFGGDLIVPVDLPLPAQTVGADERAYWGVRLADDPNLRGQTLHVQAAVLTPAQAILLGGAASITLR